MSTHKAMSPNQREVLSAISTITGQQEYLTSTSGALNTTGGGGGGGGTQYAEGATTSPATGTVALGRYNSAAPTLTNGQLYAPQLDVNGNLKVNIASGSSSGTQYTNGSAQATPTGTVALGYDGSNVRALKTAIDGTLKTVLSASQANVSGTITTSTSTVTATDLTGVGSVTIQIAGTYAGVNVTFEGSVDGTNWVPIYAQPVGSGSLALVTSSGVLTSNSVNVWNISPLLGLSQIRVRATAYTSGTANVTIDLSAQFVSYANTEMITDGTNYANVVAGDSGQNAVAFVSTRKEVSFTTSTNTAVASTDASNYRWVSVQLSSVGTGGTANFQTSNDNANWTSVVLIVSGSGTAAVATSSNSTTTILHGPIPGRYFRINVTGLSAGSVTGIAEFFSVPPQSLATNVLASQSGTYTVSGTVTANLGTGGTASTSLGKAEDAAHTTGDTMVPILGVRNDGATTAFTNANSDYNPIATDSQGRIYVVQKGPTGTTTSTAASATTVTVLAANTARIGAQITNDSSAVMYVKLGATASTTSYTVALSGASAAPFSYYEVPAGYTGVIDAIWASATGNARVTEVT